MTEEEENTKNSLCGTDQNQLDVSSEEINTDDLDTETFSTMNQTRKESGEILYNDSKVTSNKQSILGIDKESILGSNHDEDMFTVMHRVSSSFFLENSENDDYVKEKESNQSQNDKLLENGKGHEDEFRFKNEMSQTYKDEAREIAQKSADYDDENINKKCGSSIDVLKEGGRSNKLHERAEKKRKKQFDKKRNKIRNSSKHKSWNAVDVLCHDIMMHVLSFLPTSSLSAFSETARRPNFECFYFLQLQFERATIWNQIHQAQIQMGVLLSNHTDWEAMDSRIMLSCSRSKPFSLGTDDYIPSPMQSSSILARLSLLSPSHAQTLLEEYLQSNSSLRNNMSGSYRLAYIRHAFMEFTKAHKPHLPHLPNMPNLSSLSITPNTNKNNVAAAAFFMTVLGGACASYMAGVVGSSDHTTNLAAGQALLSVGLGALMNMKKGVFFHGKEEGEEMNDDIHDQFEIDESQRNEKNTETDLMEYHSNNERSLEAEENNNIDCIEYSSDCDDEYDEEIYAMENPCTPNPYDHMLPIEREYQSKKNSSANNIRNEEKKDYIHELPAISSSDPLEHESSLCLRKPSGCVGAYKSILNKATLQIEALILQNRQTRFSKLSKEEQQTYKASIVDSCTSDDNLNSVKRMVLEIGVPINEFYAGTDGWLTCPLQAAAFHGATEILEFLCRGISLVPKENSEKFDGGLADVDMTDENGWTAMHYAAGSNGVRAARILHHYGANLMVEALNGYTPYRWADRLSNIEVREELEKLGGDRRFLDLLAMGIFAEDMINVGSLEGLAESFAGRFLRH